MQKDSVTSAAAADRTLCLLTADLGNTGHEFTISVEVEALRAASAEPKIGAGFRIGRRGGIEDYRHALVHATNWIDAKIQRDGHLVLGESVSEAGLALGEGPIKLTLSGQRDGDWLNLTLVATRDSKEINVTGSFNIKDVRGGVSLLSDGPSSSAGQKASTRFAFRDFQIKGDLVAQYPKHAFGPILWSQYTLSANQLRLQTQLAPLGPRQKYKAELWIGNPEGESEWEQVASGAMDKLSRTVAFTVDDWDGTARKRYQVRFGWRNKTHVWEGRIRREPSIEEPLKLACFSCDNGYLFPILEMASQVQRQNPGMLFFAGDQIYESYGGYGVARGAKTEIPMIDFLRKYYQFGWTWRDLLRDRPRLILPDDHDVFQGNIWGHGGRNLPDCGGRKPDWTTGGYLMSGDWVNAVEKTHVGQLPDPAVDIQLPIGIKPYFTTMTYGGVGFAVLEDRKFKTRPKSIPEAQRLETEDADLLGKDQEDYLRQWSLAWKDQQMKCALSQTIFCNAATHTGPNFKRSRSFFDSGAWPKAARNRTVRILGDCNALSIHGDQHLGILLRQGVEDFDDAGYAFMVPGTANGFPRDWWPGVDKGVPKPGDDFTGKFHDDAGHPIHVFVVGNPDPDSNTLPKTGEPMEIGRRKGSGYGMVQFNKREGTVRISLYRLGHQDEMFPGFPKTIKLGRKS